MAQARVTDFFNNRKRGGDLNPSKRRKVQRITEPTEELQNNFAQALKSPPISARTRRKNISSVHGIENLDTETGGLGLKSVSATENLEKTVVIKTTATSKNNTKKQSSVKKSVRSKSKKATKNASESLNKSQSLTLNNNVNNIDIRDALKNTVQELKESISITDASNDDILDEVTASCDDHTVSPPSSPSKRASNTSSRPTQTKRSKNTKCIRKDLIESVKKTPEGMFDFSPYATSSQATHSTSPPPDSGKQIVRGRRLSDEEKDTTKVFAFSGKSVQKPANLSNVKEKLAKCGKLAELKEKLAEFNKAKQQLKSEKSSKALSGKEDTAKELVEKKVPAYERFHSLAEPIPPTLSLPFKYKVLAEMFHGVETVVSMLSKRSETCTFSKLKAAVQQIARRTFEEKNLGQIKTVYPDAYVFRQERRLQCYGRKDVGYNLTLEPDIQGIQDDSSPKTAKSQEKLVFTATNLLQRKKIFHHCLIAIVKNHHKEFLANLTNPLSIPDSKITRWHPRFRLDEVPDIEPSPLPQPPDVKKLNSAKDVLEEARGKLAPKMQKALELVYDEAVNKESNSAGPPPSAKESPVKTEPPKTNTALKGVQSSLLDRIRAKEAKKTEASLMRSPETVQRLERISRLPELVRIIRIFFVTQKKPALLKDDVIQKLSDSYRSSMGMVDAEKHLKLLMELAPDFIKEISVKKGTFLKLDMNIDINCVVSKIEKVKKQES